jgi:tetratricopeptide (TPR) repeat protein
MFENFEPSYIIAITAVISSIALLGYFSWKTLITSNVFQKGVNLYKQENYKDAEAAFRQMISLNSTNDVVHLLLGDTLMQQGKLEEAIAQFKEVIERAPKKVDAYLRLSNAFMRQEKKAEAISNLEKARELCQTQRQPEKAEQINRILQKISKNNS